MTDPSVSESESASGTSSSLLDRARSGSDAGWERLVSLYSPLVYQWCRVGGLQPSDAENVGQETFIAVARGLGRFRRERQGSFRAWLRRITRRKLVDHWRRCSKEIQGAGGSDALAFMSQAPAAADDSQEGSGPEEAGEVAILYQQAVKLIQGEFSQRDWVAFRGVVEEEKRPIVVARELGVAVNVVYLAKSRILSRLRQEFAEVIGESFP